MSDPIARLVLQLGRMPGVGEKSATRLAHYLVKNMRSSRDKGVSSLAFDLAQALLDVDAHVGLCRSCQNITVGELCGICTDTRRDESLLCVVESVADLRAIERTSAFRGRYHVLHGALSPLDGIGPEELRLPRVFERVRVGITEVIVATNANVEGDATALYLSRLLQPLGTKVTRLASGVPLGGEIEYLDQATLGRALIERRSIQ